VTNLQAAKVMAETGVDISNPKKQKA